MDGREPVGIAYVSAYFEDRRQGRGFSRWYQKVHFRDVGEIGVLENPLMFHSVAEGVQPDLNQYLAMYELYRDDLEAAMAEFSQHSGHLREDFDRQRATRSPTRGIYRVIHRVMESGAKLRSECLLAERIECEDASRADELRRWLTDVRLPQVLGLGLHHTLTVGESVGGQAAGEAPSGLRFLTLYESDSADARKVAADVARGCPPPNPPAGLMLQYAAFERARALPQKLSFGADEESGEIG